MTDQPQPRLKGGRPPLADDHRLRNPVTVRFTAADWAVIKAAATRLGIRPTAAVRILARDGAGITNPRSDTLAQLRPIGQALDRIANQLDRPRRQSTAAIADFRAAVDAAGAATAAAIADLHPQAQRNEWS